MVGIGVVGCGTISDAYLATLVALDGVEVLGCADLDVARARSKAAAHGVGWAGTVEELLADPRIELVVNLTIPAAHAAVAAAALAAGKSVYNEKPLTGELAQADALLDTAADRGLRVGGAPDTFLGAGLQTCRRLIDAGAIGEPVAATARMLNHGAEHWHLDPAFLYAPGAGPLFDMGPYYLTTLVALLGPIGRVAGSARSAFPQRVVGRGPLAGTAFAVGTPSHVAAVLDFEAGAVVTLTTSFDVWDHVNRIELYGTEGSLRLPDPNTFGGPVSLRRAGVREWEDVPLLAGPVTNSRGIGAADMALALRSGGPQRASGELARHVLEAMHAILVSAEAGTHVTLRTRCERPAPA